MLASARSGAVNSDFAAPIVEGIMMRHALHWGRLVLVLAAASLAAPAYAQPYPSKPIQLISPYGQTGMPAIVSRMVAEKVSKALGQRVIVEEKPGALGIIAAQLVAQSAPDGYTLFLTDGRMYGINPAVNSKLPYKPSDFTPITQAVRGHLVLVANPSVGADSLKELIALAKARPGSIMYGSPGNVTVHHLGMERLKFMAKIDLTHVPYKSVVQATPALLSGDVGLMFVTLATVAAHVKAAKLRILAVGSPQRSPLMPEVPTVAEAGFPGFEVFTHMGFAAPAGTPRPIIERLNAEFVKALKSEEVMSRMPALGVEVVANSPEEFAKVIRRDQEHYLRLVREIGLKLD